MKRKWEENTKFINYSKYKMRITEFILGFPNKSYKIEMI